MPLRITTIAVVLSLAISLAAAENTVLLEAEQFDDYGGWVNDSQFMDQMGSPYLLAHGLGAAVGDATTTVEVPAGKYRVWVRTRDWVATWKAPGTPGRFQLLVNGKRLKTTFGTEGAEWHWQDGGTIELAAGKTAVALHDLTGFEGRCDAIVLTTDSKFTPPNKNPEMAAFRRKMLRLAEKPDDAGTFDLVVVGGGIAGTCAAISAARLDLKVALIQDRPVLGGNNSSEVRVWLQGWRNKEPYPRVGDVVAELEQKKRAHYGPTNTAELYEDDKKLALARAEKNLSLFLCHRANEVETADGRIVAVIAQETKTGRRKRFAARWFADCTGDGCIGALAGADFEMTPKGHMGRCNLWNVADTGKPVTFPRCPWALDLTKKPFPGRSSGGIRSLGGWYWESGFDHDPFEKSEYIRDWNFRATYGAWDALKNVDKKYPNHKLNWLAHIAGKRESRRLLGDVILSKEDLIKARKYPDGCVPTGWKMDLHLPNKRYEKGFEGDAFISHAIFTDYPKPYWVPYRCLYSRNVPNLFMAGRDVSVTHGALGATRVMRTNGCMGEIVGMASSLCKKHDSDPRGVYKEHLDDLKELMTRGVGKPKAVGQVSNLSPGALDRLQTCPTKLTPPAWLKTAGSNLARKAAITVSGSKAPSANPPSLINDGRIDLQNDTRWLSDATLPHQITLTWPQPQTVSAVRIVSGYRQPNGIVAPIADFHLQYHAGPEWRDIATAKTTGNTRLDWHVRFPAVKTDAIRLAITATRTDVSRIWELELYHPASSR